MGDSLPISSRDFASSLLDSTPARALAPPIDSDVSSEQTSSFSKALVGATRDWGPQPNAAATSPPAPSSASQSGVPPKPHAPVEQATPPARPDETARQAQELPPEVDADSRKTDAEAVPPAQPQSDEVDSTPLPTEISPEIEAPAPRPTKETAEVPVVEHASPSVELRTEQPAPIAPTPAPAPTPPTESSEFTPPPPAQAAPDSSTPPPVSVDPAVLAAPPRSSVRHSPPTSKHGESNNSAPSAEPKAHDAPTSDANRTQNQPLPPAPSASESPTPAPHAHGNSAPSTNGASFLDLQPHAPTSTTSGNGATQPTTTSSHGVPIPTAPETKAETFSPQIVRGALAMTRSSGGAMTMRLEPESLGALRIQMQMSQGRVTVQFHAETAEARGLLNQHVQTLRQAMESQGLKLDSVQIHTLSRPASSHSAGQEHSQSHSQSSGDNAPRQDAGGQQSRGHADTSERQAQYRQAARQFMSQGQRNSSWRQQWNDATASANATTPSLAGQP